jgi:hypothetical protein
MKQAIGGLGAATLAAVLGLTFAADAQTVHRHARHVTVTETGRVIVVHPRESFLTAGPSAPVGTYNGYALDTVSGSRINMPGIDRNFISARGLEQLPDNLSLPGCCGP